MAETKAKKSWYTRWWAIVLFVFIGLIILGSLFGGNNSTSDNNVVNQQNTQTQPSQNTETTAPQPTTPAVEEQLDKATMGEKNALGKALSYLSVMPFSYKGLIKQLEYEGYTHEEAVYGADNSGADWNEQAALKAQSYLDTMQFSRDGLIKQLEYEGFTKEQAEYGVQAVGY